jgi:nucleotide-binding universal stress UspA family protein
MKTFLVAVDFSDVANLVVQRAGGLAQQLSAKIVLLHVFEPKPAYVPVGETMGVVIGAAWPLTTPQGLADQEARLNSLADLLKVVGVEVEYVTIVGLLVDEILEQSVKYHADYIILGSRGHVAAQHFLSGNVFTEILPRLTCPLIVIPAKSEI